MDKEVTPLPNQRQLVLMLPALPYEPMQRGFCPVCRTSIEGWTEGGGMIVERNVAGTAVPGSSLSTGWGHLHCIEPLYFQLVRLVVNRKPFPDVVAEPAAEEIPWQRGTQTEMIRAMRLHQPQSIVVNMDESGTRGKTERYRWRIARKSEEERST
jgi:hypothetical protein